VERATAFPYFRSKARLRPVILRVVRGSLQLSSSLLLFALIRRVCLLLSVDAILCDANDDDDIDVFADVSLTENAVA